MTGGDLSKYFCHDRQELKQALMVDPGCSQVFPAGSFEQ
jgi:hypothetical protein